jgi:hypothetical protein
MSKNSKDMLDAVSVEWAPQDIDLFPHIAARINQNRLTGFRRVKPVYVVGIVLIVIAVLIVSLPSAANAMRRLFRFIPGIGLVEPEAGYRLLAEPARVERDGVTVTVPQGTVDSQRTVLLLQVDFAVVSGQPSQPSDCANPGNPHIRLPDGSILANTARSGYGYERGYSQRLIFPAVPANDTVAMLELPCLMPFVPGQWPENWQIPLHFIPGDPSQLAPVIELNPTSPAATSSAPVQPTGHPASQTTVPTSPANPPAVPTSLVTPTNQAPPFGITMTLEKVAELPDGYVLMGNMHWTDPTIPDYGVTVAPNPTILDAAGQPIPYEEQAPDSVPAPDSKTYAWSYKILGKHIAWPITLTASANVTLNVDAAFPLDLGAHPKPGQSWSPNLDLPAGEHNLHVLSVASAADPAGNGMLTFTIQSDPAVTNVVLEDRDHKALGGGGGGDGSPTQGPFTTEFSYNGQLPSGVVTIHVDQITLTLRDLWKITWQP